MVTKKHHLILDTDIGSDVDDALALLFAIKSPQIQLEGVSTVYGKTDIRAKIARKICDYAGRSDIPVCAGESKPLGSPYPVWHTGREGDRILNARDRAASLTKMKIRYSAVEFLINKLSEGPLTVVTIGALTNVASAIKKKPAICKNIRRIYMMAGAISWPYGDLDLNRPVLTDSPEHNIGCDIVAARVVLSADIPKTIVPLDVTWKVPIARSEFEKLAGLDRVSDCVKNLVDDWFDYRDHVFQKRVTRTRMHDPLTVAAVIDPTLVKTARVLISVDNSGITRIGAGHPVDLCYAVNVKKFRKIFRSTIFSSTLDFAEERKRGTRKIPAPH